MLVLVALMGLVRPSDLGLRAALIADTMPPEQLTGAMGMSRITSDSARIAGALTGAGLFALLGMGPAYIVIAIVLCAQRVPHLAGGFRAFEDSDGAGGGDRHRPGVGLDAICAKASSISGTRRA